MEINTFFRNNFGFSEKTMDALELSGYFENVDIAEYRKKDIIIHEGENLDSVYFLVKGVVRWFLLDEKGNELTDYLVYNTGDFVSPYHFNDTPCMVDIQAITNVQTIRVPKLGFNTLMEQHPEVLNKSIRMMSDRFLEHWTYSVKIHSLNSMDRYQWFVKNHGRLIGRISNKYIASYLTMTPSTLSRIQKRYRELQQDT